MNGSGLGLIVILFFFGLAGGAVGRMKGSGFVVWFLISFCIPFLGLLCAVLYRYEDRELRRPCPDCGKIVSLQDAICTRCGAELAFPEVAYAGRRPIRR